MNMKKVLLDKLVQYRTYRDSEASLKVEKVYVLMRHVSNVRHDEKCITAIDNI
jgi:hypothetical protein